MVVNTQIRSAASRAVERQRLTQKQLAERVGMSQPAVGRVLNGARKGDPDSWQRILDALGLELVAVPKGTDVSQLLEEKGR
jgi:transcriptional regulator with XRE-family HTH domain